MYDDDLSLLMARSSARITTEMNAAAPAMGEIVGPWIENLSPDEAPESYFKYPFAYPILLLPWWLEGALARERDPGFMGDVINSTMCGYYFIRLLDNLMDGHATLELEILPAAGFFHVRFQAAYQPYFPAGHAFWQVFEREWFRCAEAVILDRRLETVDRERFIGVSARKLRAALIPVAAVCYQYERPDLIESWTPFCDLLASCVQMTDDVFDWQLDAGEPGPTTWFLSEGERRKRPGESIAAWVMREGFAWGLSTVRDFLDELEMRAARLDCPPASAYVDWRLRMLDEREQALSTTHAELARIADALE